MRKYPDHETFAVGDLVLVYHPLGSVLNSHSRKLNRNWVGPLRIQTVLDNTDYLCSDWSGMLVPKRLPHKQTKRVLHEFGRNRRKWSTENVQNVNELYDVWHDLKEDELPKENSQK